MRYSVLKRKMNFLSLTKIWSVLNNAWNKGEFLRSCFFIPCCWLVLKKWQSKNITFFSEAWCKEWIKIITQLRIMSNKQFLELLYSTHYTLVFITGTLCKMRIKVVPIFSKKKQQASEDVTVSNIHTMIVFRRCDLYDYTSAHRRMFEFWAKWQKFKLFHVLHVGRFFSESHNNCQMTPLS